MGSMQESSQPDIPSGFSTVRQILNLPNDSVSAGVFVNVIGFLKDVQDPIQTKGTDAKCTLEIIDHSIQYEAHGLKATIFWPMANMPKFSGVADAVLIRSIKVQMWGGTVSLLANRSSSFHVMKSTQIPASLLAKPTAQWSSYPASKVSTPKSSETAYVIWAHTHREEWDLPSDTEFQEKRLHSANVKDKFSLLQNVKSDCFYDILGEVVKVYDGSSGSLTVYLSDYTANSKFFDQIWGGGDDDGVTCDENDYVISQSKPKKGAEWHGPYGKMSIQITLFDAHASFVRENVKIKEWVLLTNVQVKYGNTGSYLEGFLRGDLDAFEGKIRVTVLKVTDDPGTIDLRLKAALSRKLQWTKKFKQKQQAILDKSERPSDKRKREDGEPLKLNSRQRRQEKRAAAEKKDTEGKQTKQLDLNPNIKCTRLNSEPVTISQILKPRDLHLENQQCDSPFTLCKYRANVRVVDYFPHRVEDFAVGRRSSEFDALSDYSGGEDTDPEEAKRIFKSGKGFRDRWEWRFALQVEDAEAKDSKDRIWLMVDNQAAQGLLGLEDNATNLRGDSALLSRLKEQLFKLWGDLEERKSAALPKRTLKGIKELPQPSFDTEASGSSPPRRAGAMPDLEDSDAENDLPVHKSSAKKLSTLVLEECDPNVNGDGGENSNTGLMPKNKAFPCCIQQYGVKLDEMDPSKANAGDGKRWQRLFALFETQIL